MSLSDKFAIESEIARLKSEQVATLRQLADAKRKNLGMVEAAYKAARDAAAALHFKPVAAPKADTRRKTAETAIAVLSDWQLGKRTPSYTSAICEQRIEEYAERVRVVAGIQRADHPVTDLRVYLLGDIVEGEMIFPGQAHLIDASLFVQTMVDGPRILGNFLRRMLSVFERVHVVGVIGNHGALGGPVRRDYHPESNADAFMYEFTRRVLEGEKRLTWAANLKPGERNWYAVDYVGEKGFLLFHGDQIKGGFAGFPWYGFSKKIQGWAMGAIHEKFHYALSGHFHTPVRGLYGRIRHWGNGSTESDNTYAAERLAAQGTPSQWLLFAHPNHGVTSEHEIHLATD